MDEAATAAEDKQNNTAAEQKHEQCYSPTHLSQLLQQTMHPSKETLGIWLDDAATFISNEQALLRYGRVCR